MLTDGIQTFLDKTWVIGKNKRGVANSPFFCYRNGNGPKCPETGGLFYL